MLQRNEAAAEKQTAAAQLLSLCSRAWEGQLLKPPAPWSPLWPTLCSLPPPSGMPPASQHSWSKECRRTCQAGWQDGGPPGRASPDVQRGQALGSSSQAVPWEGLPRGREPTGAAELDRPKFKS